MRYLGLDIGSKTIGVAVGEMLAEELATLRATKTEQFYRPPALDRAIHEIFELKAKQQADAIVIGLPINEDGGETEESGKIRAFADHLEKKANCRIHFVNETLTSFMAADILEEQGVSGEKAIDERIHQLSAALILQQFLEEDAVS